MKKYLILLAVFGCFNAFAIERRPYVAPTVIPTLDTNIYASGDQLSSTVNTISNVVLENGGYAVLEGISVVDSAKQSSAFDILFFNASPTLVSSWNNIIDISDSDMASKFIGSVTVAAADYLTLNASSVAAEKNIILPFKAAAGTKDIYIILVSRGTPTYTAATDLKLTFHFHQN